jgi:predicted ester cyclase
VALVREVGFVVELLGIPPTGKRITISLIDVNRIAGGRLAERWAEIDTLGVLPSPEQPDA